MLTAPSPSLGLLGWVLLAVLWVGPTLLVLSVVRAVWRWFFPERHGEYVRVLHELPPQHEAKR